MPVGGVWWVNSDRNEDAISLVNQTIAAQGKDSRVAVISMGEDLKQIITLERDRGPQTVRACFPCRRKQIVYTICPATFSVPSIQTAFY